MGSHPFADWAQAILVAEGIVGWRVRVQGIISGVGCCCRKTSEIVLPADGKQGITLHEIAHVGHPGHRRDWQARLTELVDRYTVEVWTVSP